MQSAPCWNKITWDCKRGAVHQFSRRRCQVLLRSSAYPQQDPGEFVHPIWSTQPCLEGSLQVAVKSLHQTI